MLAEYEPWVISRVTDPRIGIASTLKFLPTVAEVKQACEAEMAPIHRENARRKVEEDRLLRLAEPEEDRANRPNYEELQRRCHAAGLPIGETPSRAAATEQEITDLKAKYGISDAAWDDLPDVASSRHGTMKPLPIVEAASIVGE